MTLTFGSATHCKECGQKLPTAPERQPFTVAALNRIKLGATARDLGWPETFYLSVCRKHGLQPNRNTPKTQAQPEIASTPIIPDIPVPKQLDKPSSPAEGVVTFYPATRMVTRGDHRAMLSHRVATVFAHVIKGTPDNPANGRQIAELVGLVHSGAGVGGQILSIRNKLFPLDLQVIAQSGKYNSGYWLADLHTAAPVKVRVLR